MRNKKLLSTVVATTLIASTMVMPVMAEGTNFDVNVTTKTAVLRVKVPTTIAIAVDQFEMVDEGTQIYSGEFTMENMSAIGVKVGITSTADLKSTTKLVSTKEAAAADTSKEGEAWLAVAAQTSDDSYADGSATALKDLTEANKNVTTFKTDATDGKGKAEQTYYFKKASTPAYKLLNANESAADIQYAQFYELTKETVSSADDLAALLKDKDVYVAAAAATDGQALTLVAKGGTHTYAASEIYYTAADTATAKASITDTHTELFVYAEGTADATEGKGAFRYIGKLSGQQETWTNTDIPKVNIAYDIVGVDETGYNKVKNDCTYGLYKEPSYVSANTISASSNSLTLTLPTGVTLSKAEITYEDGTGAVTLGADQYTVSGSTLTVPANLITAWTGLNPAFTKLVLTFSDSKSATIAMQ